MVIFEVLLWAASLASLGGNLLLLAFNIFLMNLFRKLFGLLHIETMTQILTGIKPLQTSLNILIFVAGVGRHRRLLASLAVSERLFRENLDFAAPFRRLSRALFAVVAVAFAVTFSLRFSQYALSGERPGQIFLADFSLLFVPALSVLQVLPLAYFVALNVLICAWFRQLDKALREDVALKKHRVDFYYSHYLKLCGTVQDMGTFFNPFIFVSLAISVVILCLTIYFFINAKEIFHIPPGLGTEQIMVIVFQPIWAGIQILTAVLYAVAVTLTGIRTNETARGILQTVLLLLPPDELSRFQVMLFTQKVQQQYAWGVTVWKAFPVERSLLITLVSGILTYTVVLIKLQQSARLESASPDKISALLNGTLP